MAKIDEETAAAWVGAQAASSRETVRTTVDMPAELHRELRQFGAEHGLKSAVILRGLLVEMLTDQKLAAKVIKRAGGA